MSKRKFLLLLLGTIFCGLQSAACAQSFDYITKDYDTGKLEHQTISESDSQAILEVKKDAQVDSGLVPSFTVLGPNLWLVSLTGSDAINEKALAAQGDRFQVRPLLIYKDGTLFGLTGTLTIALNRGIKRDDFRSRLAQFGLQSLSDVEMDGYELAHPHQIVAKLVAPYATNARLIEANDRVVQDLSDVRWVDLDFLSQVRPFGSSTSAGITR